MPIHKATHSQRVRRNRGEIERLVHEYHRSGLTQGQYAARMGVALSTVTRWLRDTRGKARPIATSSPMFVEVDVLQGPGGHPGGIYQIDLPGGARLRIEGVWQDQQVRQLLNILTRP